MNVLYPQWSNHVAKCLNVAPEQVCKTLQNITLDGEEDGAMAQAGDDQPSVPHWLLVSSPQLNLDDDESQQRIALKEYMRLMYSQ